MYNFLPEFNNKNWIKIFYPQSRIRTRPPSWNRFQRNIFQESGVMSFSLDYLLTKKQLLNTKFCCLLLFCSRNQQEKRQPGLFSFLLWQQHKSKQCNLVFSIGFLVTSWSNGKDINYQMVTVIKWGWSINFR